MRRCSRSDRAGHLKLRASVWMQQEHVASIGSSRAAQSGEICAEMVLGKPSLHLRQAARVPGSSIYNVSSLRLGAGLQRTFIDLAGADADCLGDRIDKNLAISNFAGACRLHDGIDG